MLLKHTQDHLTRKLAYVLAVILIAFAALAGLAFASLTLAPVASGKQPQAAQAAPAASCTDGNVPSDINVDTTLSGDLYVTDDVYIDGYATLTLTEGSHVMMCGEYDLRLNRYAVFIAEGTAGAPIVFDAADGVAHWGQIDIGWDSYTSTLRHVTLNDAGGNVPTTEFAALNLYPLGSNSPDIAGPVVDHVTINNSGAYGIIVRSYHEDPTPPALSNLTINNSANAPIWMQSANDVGGLGMGNSFTNNMTNTIQVGDWGSFLYSHTWHAQPIPYQLLESIAVRGPLTPALTLEPGTSLLLNPNVDLTIGRQGALVAKGTANAPITFDTADATQKWGQLYFGWETAISSTLRYVTLKNGGGNDPLADVGTLHVEAQGNTPDVVGPVIDHLTIEDSGAYGAVVISYHPDKTPPSLSNLTITGSQNAPLLIDAADLTGLGTGNTLTGNLTDTIQLRASSENLIYTHTWRTQPVPIEVLGTLLIRGGKLTIEGGNTFLMHEGTDFKVGSLYGRGGLVVDGTPAHPVTFTRASASSGPWGSISYAGAHLWPNASRLSYVNVLYGGGNAPGNRDGAVALGAGGVLPVDNLTVRYSLNAGVHSDGDALVMHDSLIEGNRIGVKFNDNNAQALLRNNVIQSNSEGGLVNGWPNRTCIDAIGNYWGAPDGPSHTSSAADACNNTMTNAGAGNSISDGALFSPWLSGAPGSGVQDASSISPETYWVIADGVDTTVLEITVRDASGTPLVGKQIAVESTRGTLQQPTAPTDADGKTTAVITSTETGGATISARNVTDGSPLSALASVYFWSGLGETGGLIDPGGVPYVSPQLVLEGRPFQQGFPMIFMVPMQNSNAEAAEVTVRYLVSNLGIGARFTEVAVVSKTLAPGEAWDARAVWSPPLTGHRCARARMDVTLPASGYALQEAIDVGPLQVNFDVPSDPCDKTDVSKLIPSGAGVKGVAKHFARALIQMYLVKECLGQTLTFANMNLVAAPAAAQRDYEVVVTPPEYTPPALQPGDGVTQEQADAATAAGEIAADLAGLNEALMETSERMQEAGQAGDEEAVARQQSAYSDFQNQYAERLDDLADALDDLLAVTADMGEADTLFMPEEYQAYIETLRTSGYPQEERDFFLATGLSTAQIDAIRQAEIAEMQQVPGQPISFYESVRAVRDALRAHATRIRSRYAPVIQPGLAAIAADTFYVGTLKAPFVVGNPRTTQETVDLRIRPVDVPLDWSYYLDTQAPTLAAGETMTVTLTVEPGSRMVTGDVVKIAVEGFIDDTYVGGILFERAVPAVDKRIYLPLITKGL